MMSGQYPKLERFIGDLPPKSLITVDVGNSHPHFASFVAGQLHSVAPLTEQVLHGNPYATSTVTQRDQNSFDHLWDGSSFASMPVDYSKQLGSDRLYQAALLYHLYPNQPTALIDAGTFMTIDFIDHKGFRGGYIYPGLKTFLTSYRAGDRLPTLTIEDLANFNVSDLPHNTRSAILSAASHYLLGIFRAHNFEGQKIILTGGEAHLIKPHIKEADLIPHLIHYALYFLDSMEQKQ